MRHHLAKLTPALLVGGCSLIYNPSSIKPPVDATDAPMVDAEITADAAIDAPPLADVNPAALVVEQVFPTKIYEGQGTGGSRPALIVLRGHHFTPDATIVITPATNITQGTPVFSLNGDFVLVPVTAAVSDLMDTELVPLTVTVNEPGAPQQVVTGQLTLQYLPELDTGSPIATPLAELYSKVALANVTFTGTAPALVRSVSSIVMGNVSVSGADGNMGTAGAGGAGGCAGGAAGVQGGCLPNLGGGQGAAGSTSNGGGGGGFGTVGGNGGGGATGGAVHGNAQLLNYVTDSTNTNRSGGGGGGQETGLGGGVGGAGGGGGGTLELTAGGNITTGTISANGGKGGDANGVAMLTDSAGGGGGGSGGVVLIRSEAGTIMPGSISAVGGLAGLGKFSGGGGGVGGDGRIRISSPAAPPTTNPTNRRGTSFAVATPFSVTTEKPTLMLFGTTGDKLDGYVVGMDNLVHTGEPINQEIAGGSVSVTPTLLPGYNRLCFTLQPAVRPQNPPSYTLELPDTCIEIVYLP